MNIYPSFKCNFNCRFCALHKLPGKTIDLDWLEQVFKDYPWLAEDINILGGEPTILPHEYQERLVDICTKAEGVPPYFITNLYRTDSPVLDKVRLIVSYDFMIREHWSDVFQNMMMLDQPFSISTIMTKNLVENVGAERYLKAINHLRNLERADLVMYRGGLTETDDTPDHDKLMEFQLAVCDHPKVNLTPYSSMKGVIDNSFDNLPARLGLLPDNKFGVRIDYNHVGYKPFDTMEEAMEYFHTRVESIKQTAPCSDCNYIGRCWCVGGYEDGVCHGDKEMMEAFDKHVHAACK